MYDVRFRVRSMNAASRRAMGVSPEGFCMGVRPLPPSYGSTIPCAVVSSHPNRLFAQNELRFALLSFRAVLAPRFDPVALAYEKREDER